MADEPIRLFDQWLEEARATEPNDPEAMALATADPDGRIGCRMVLLKGHGPDGFHFYTNAGSDKGEQLAAWPRAALLFHWKSRRRQVRIEGPVEALTEAQSDAYYATRSRESRLSAWASRQSRPLASRAEFEREYAEATERFEGRDVDRPDYWRGFRVVPERIEFWEDGAHRLHHRRLFVREGGGWSEGLLYP